MTYSLVAKDPESGALGVAVQSHFLAVGANVPWGRAGVGVVATQATVDRRYGARGLSLMSAGSSAAEALQACLAADDAPETRQVGMLDATGRTAAHTGTRCWQWNAHATRDGAAAQANMVTDAAIPTAMLAAFTAAPGDFGSRLLAALNAAEALGGDLRGRQSAALLVVSGARSDDGVLVDLRVDDHPEPLVELRRVYGVHQAFTQMLPAMRGRSCRGPVPADPAEVDAAVAAFAAAQKEYGPSNVEPTFWQAVALHRGGRVAEASRLVAELRAEHPGWGTLFGHVTAVQSSC
ncbi:DUF1028 domain-containing protein [Amycolatopsis jejuensis]|uniref:DUF1028 domain-containing protein n=1 Tax=Amycolatopsis jejuensis TaxID=330084 RepID=UPI000690AF54|nr:DUF1028 domain-containing protein [Amycolatopsis jejuensis]